MDFPTLSPKLLNAGREYHNQLKQLGLKPEGLLWMHDAVRNRFHLWLIWSGIDRVGPLAVSELLFKAYRASALTQDIDPFVVEVRSLREEMARQLLAAISKSDPFPYYRILLNHPDGQQQVAYQWRSDWIYYLQPKPRKPVEIANDWRRFSQKVTALAA